MLSLRVEHFSCIQRANLGLGRFNVIVGPQASGKSVLSKLTYFFIDAVATQQQFASNERPFDEFVEEVKVRFSDWFPVPAWGKEKFVIEFVMGKYSLRLTRTSYAGSTKNNLRLTPSPLVRTHHDRIRKLSAEARLDQSTRGDADIEVFRGRLRIERAARDLLEKAIGDDSVLSQTFVPAGRSFFTTLGKALVAFDQGLDPLTVRFGRLYSLLQDNFAPRHSGGSGVYNLDHELSELLGGSIAWEGDRSFLRSKDGRAVPFAALSSGQQELLPLLLTIQNARRSPMRSTEPLSHLLVIEEPEAHLFPRAQSQLVEGLATLVSNAQRRLLITTHSPYVLSKINNLAKAGGLEGSLSPKKLAKLDEIVPKAARIEPDGLRAYAIRDGMLEEIVDADGLIDGEYLDSISSDLGDQFHALLSLEYDL